MVDMVDYAGACLHLLAGVPALEISKSHSCVDCLRGGLVLGLREVLFSAQAVEELG